MRAPARATGATPGSIAWLWPVWLLIAGAWLTALLAQVTGQAAALHHHALLSKGGPPLWLAIPISLAGWQVMTAAMMLPASLPAIHAVGASPVGSMRRPLVVAAFLGVYAVIWSAFGLAAFIGDDVLHSFVHATPWLADRPELVGAAVLGIAGAYQFVPRKHRALAACRQPDDRVSIDSTERGAFRAAIRAGRRHAVDCIASSSALMLLMFAAGFANLVWMAILTAVMTYEAIGRHGHGVAATFGYVLLGLAAASIAGLVPGI